MKRLFLLTILPAVLLLSCNKSHDTGTSYYINATIDGVSKSYTGNVFATKTADNKSYTININGLLSSSAGDGIDVLVSSNNPSQAIGTGTYTDSSSVYTVLLAYAPSPTGTGYSGGTATSDSASNHGIAITHHLQVVISSISSVEVQGSFSGDIFLSGNASGDKKTVTNGTFFAKFQ